MTRTNTTRPAHAVAPRRAAIAVFAGIAAVTTVAGCTAGAVEAALLNQPWSLATITTVLPAFAQDFHPLSDMRASAEYRLTAAQNLLIRYFHDLTGTATNVLQVQA